MRAFEQVHIIPHRERWIGMQLFGSWPLWGQAAYLLALAFAMEEGSKLPASSQTFFTPWLLSDSSKSGLILTA